MQNNRKDQECKQNQDGAMQETFLIRKADEADVVGIMKVMNEAQGDKEHPDWFVADNEDYIRAHLKEHGFVVVAESSEEEIAGFFLINILKIRKIIWGLISILMKNSLHM